MDLAPRVDADAVDVAALQVREHISLRVAHADIGGFAFVFLLGDVVIAIFAAGNLVGTAHAGPLSEVFALGREDLPALPMRATL